MQLRPCCFGLIQKRSEVTEDAMDQNRSHTDSVVELVTEGRIDL